MDEIKFTEEELKFIYDTIDYYDSVVHHQQSDEGIVIMEYLLNHKLKKYKDDKYGCL